MNDKKSSLAIILLFTVFSTDGRNTRKQSITSELDMEDYGADVFCKRKNRLIKTKKSDEIFVVDTFPGKSILLQCKYCEEKGSRKPMIWNRQEHIFTGIISEVKPSMDDDYSSSHLFITGDHSMVLRNITKNDLGMYFCNTPYASSPEIHFSFLVDFIEKSCDDIKGTTADLKNYTQFYILTLDSIVSHKNFRESNGTYMKVLIEWSDWSDCDFYFRKEGIRYRTGRCKVKSFSRLFNSLSMNYRPFNGFTLYDYQNTQTSEKPESSVTDVSAVRKNIIEFSIALSCNSHLLRILYPDIYNLTYKTPNFILSEKCSLPYKGRSRKGPRYRKSIILATGAHLTLVCPDSTIDSQVQWEHDQVRLWPNEGSDYVLKTGEPRLYVDSFNTLYLFEVTEKESGNYTCFVDGWRMQEVKIIVLTRSLFFTKEFSRHLKYLGCVFIICSLVYTIGLLITCVKMHTENKMKKAFGKEETKLLIGKNYCNSEMKSN